MLFDMDIRMLYSSQGLVKSPSSDILNRDTVFRTVDPI